MASLELGCVCVFVEVVEKEAGGAGEGATYSDAPPRGSTPYNFTYQLYLSGALFTPIKISFFLFFQRCGGD